MSDKEHEGGIPVDEAFATNMARLFDRMARITGDPDFSTQAARYALRSTAPEAVNILGRSIRTASAEAERVSRRKPPTP